MIPVLAEGLYAQLDAVVGQQAEYEGKGLLVKRWPWHGLSACVLDSVVGSCMHQAFCKASATRACCFALVRIQGSGLIVTTGRLLEVNDLYPPPTTRDGSFAFVESF